MAAFLPSRETRYSITASSPLARMTRYPSTVPNSASDGSWFLRNSASREGVSTAESRSPVTKLYAVEMPATIAPLALRDEQCQNSPSRTTGPCVSETGRIAPDGCRSHWTSGASAGRPFSVTRGGLHWPSAATGVSSSWTSAAGVSGEDATGKSAGLSSPVTPRHTRNATIASARSTSAPETSHARPNGLEESASALAISGLQSVLSGWGRIRRRSA
uniref:Putative proteophosphoglycan n=1 Tax=Micrococcus sp. 28 TaxID=161213 RepID=Q8VPM7_9MICC|nr:putative proteophosphoglycan [Micrococcus sp. 28]